MTARKSDDATGSLSFEQSLERIETIVAEMEGGDLLLKDMIARFEEGQSLIKNYTKQLNEVERKIEKLVEKDGALTTEPFEKGPDAPEEGDSEGELF